MGDLIPCPFCGSDSVINTVTNDYKYGVYCADCCGGIYPFYDTEVEATEAWNTRANAERDSLRKRLKTQADSFAKLERDNAKLRDTLERVRELAGDA